MPGGCGLLRALPRSVGPSSGYTTTCRPAARNALAHSSRLASAAAGAGRGSPACPANSGAQEAAAAKRCCPWHIPLTLVRHHRPAVVVGWVGLGPLPCRHVAVCRPQGCAGSGRCCAAMAPRAGACRLQEATRGPQERDACGYWPQGAQGCTAQQHDPARLIELWPSNAMCVVLSLWAQKVQHPQQGWARGFTEISSTLDRWSTVHALLPCLPGSPAEARGSQPRVQARPRGWAFPGETPTRTCGLPGGQEQVQPGTEACATCPPAHLTACRWLGTLDASDAEAALARAKRYKWVAAQH